MARTVSVTLPHRLSRAEARERIRGGFDQMSSAIGMAVRVDQIWQGDEMQFRADALGQSVTGRLDVRDSEVLVEVTLPGLLGAMAGRITEKLKEKGTLLLTKK